MEFPAHQFVTSEGKAYDATEDGLNAAISGIPEGGTVFFPPEYVRCEQTVAFDKRMQWIGSSRHGGIESSADPIVDVRYTGACSLLRDISIKAVSQRNSQTGILFSGAPVLRCFNVYILYPDVGLAKSGEGRVRVKAMGGAVDGCRSYAAKIDDGFIHAIGWEISNSGPVRIRNAGRAKNAGRTLESCTFGQYGGKGQDCEVILLQGARNVTIRGCLFSGRQTADRWSCIRIEDYGGEAAENILIQGNNFFPEPSRFSYGHL